jgi:hypothetical protein
MVEIGANLKGDLEQQLAKYEQTIKQKVLLSGVAAMAQVLYDEVKLNASGDRKGQGGPGKVTGNLAKSIYRAYIPERSTGAFKTYVVTWRKGGAAQDGAPHGFLVEFGTSRSPAFPFVRPAISKIQAAIEAGQRRMAVRLTEESGSLFGSVAEITGSE